MNAPVNQSRERYRRVEQKLQDLVKQIRNPKQLADTIAGTSEATADLFSSGTTPAVRMTVYTPAPDPVIPPVG
jgi:hypothetical protein